MKDKLGKISFMLLAAFLFVTISHYIKEAKAESDNFALHSVAVVDVKRIVDESKAAIDAEREVNNLRDKYLKQAQEQEKKLKAREKELVQQQKALSEDEMKKKVKEFQEKLQAEQKNITKKRKILEAAYIKSLELVRDETIKVVAEIASEKNIDLVLPKSQLLFHKKGIDISDEVLSKLNEKLTKVNINVEEGKKDK